MGDRARQSRISGRVGLLLAALLGAAASFALNQTAEIGELTPISETFDVARSSDGSPRFGGRSSTVTVVLFTDYRCPACRQSDQAFMQAVKDDGHVDLIVRPLILFGPESERGARASLAAHKQGRFLAMHRALMSAARIDDAGIAQAAQRADVNLRQLKAELDRNGGSIDRAIGRNSLAAIGLGMAGTPSYLVGRYRVMGALSAREVRRLLRQARAQDAALDQRRTPNQSPNAGPGLTHVIGIGLERGRLI